MIFIKKLTINTLQRSISIITSRKLGSLFLIGMLATGIFTIPHTTLRPAFHSLSTSAWTYSSQKIYPAYSKTAFSRPASRYSEASQCQTLPRQRMKWSCHFMNDFLIHFAAALYHITRTKVLPCHVCIHAPMLPLLLYTSHIGGHQSYTHRQ